MIDEFLKSIEIKNKMGALLQIKTTANWGRFMSKFLFIRLSISIIFWSVLAVVFQNCSKVKFIPSNSDEINLASISKCTLPKIEINNTCQDLC